MLTPETEERPSKKRRVSDEGSQSAAGAIQINNEATLENGAIGSGPNLRNDSLPTVNEIVDVGGDGTGKTGSRAERYGGPKSSEVIENGLPPPHETAPLAQSTNSNQTEPSMSKNQLKKLRKTQEWESRRDERKVLRKEKLIAKRERKRAAREQPDYQPPLPYVKGKRTQLPVTILIDCNFDDLMRDNERKSLASQVTRSYSDYKNSALQPHLAVCSFGGKLRERFDGVLTHYKGWRGIRFLECDFVEAAEKAKGWMLDDVKGGKLAGAFSKLSPADDDEGEEAQAKLREQGDVVYLTSEADETLSELKPYSTYIIGGLVDKNREKGICYKRAAKRGIKTAKLPIGEFMDMQSRKVLATNHVNEIMLKWLECGDWGEAFMKVIPKRKGGKLKGQADEDETPGADEEQEPNGHLSDTAAEADPMDAELDVDSKHELENDGQSCCTALDDPS